jgi:hypothetical protein
MMGMMVAYWHKDGLDVYQYVDKKLVKKASGSLDKLKPIRGVLDKKVLIVGREILLYTRKRYPPAPKEKLTKAVGLEIGDIFPISKPAFHCRVYDSSTTYTTLDIWAWGNEQYARLREIFPFNYIIPEDLAYFSDVPEVRIFQYKGMVNILAHSGDRFLGGASYPDSGINEKEVERFLSGLGKYGSDIKRIKVYGQIQLQFKETKIPGISRVAIGDYSPCMDYVSSLNLNEFKVKGDYHLSSKIYLLSRIFVYFILGYGTMLYFSVRNYEQAAGEIRKKINSIDAKMSNKGAGQTVTDYSEVVREVNERLSKRYSPLRVMDMIAGKLPPGSLVIRMVLNENNLEITASSKDPLSVVKALGSTEGIKTARLKGAPVMDMATRFYNFVIMMELSR